MKTFVDRFLDGEVPVDRAADAIDDAVDAWHHSNGEVGLIEFLGLTKSEYAEWLSDSSALDRILARRAAGLADGGAMFIAEEPPAT